MHGWIIAQSAWGGIFTGANGLSHVYDERRIHIKLKITINHLLSCCQINKIQQLKHIASWAHAAKMYKCMSLFTFWLLKIQ